MKSQWVIRVSALAALIAAGVVFARWAPSDEGRRRDGDLVMGRQRTDLDRARQRLRSGQYDEAVEFAQSAAERGGDRAFALRVLAEAYRRRAQEGDREREMATWRRVDEVETEASRRFRFASDFHRLGLVRLSIGEEESAREAFARGAEILRAQIAGADEGDALLASWHYDLACYEALAGERETAIEAFVRSIEMGFRDARHIRRDTDLDSIREDPRFVEALDGISGRSREPAMRAD
jgi:tetratricopeptide (TPR) repeat protein